MTTPYYTDDRVTLYHGDCLDVLRGLPDASIDAVATDPPYGISFMGKRWDRPDQSGSQRRAGTAMLSFQQWCTEWTTECLRVLKPGGHLLSFGGSRTWHRLACAVEDAGFEIRDSIAWLYGSGFPKSHDVSKAIDKANGRRFEDRYALGRHIRERREAAGLTRADVNAWFGYRDGCEHWERQDPSGARVPTLADWSILSERLGLSSEFRELVERVEADREVVGRGSNWGASTAAAGKQAYGDYAGGWDITAPATPEARQWQGWGTALKPAFEPIVVGRKPLAGTVAANVLEHGTGALNIDACRVGDGGGTTKGNPPKGESNGIYGNGINGACDIVDLGKGRWPTNVVLDDAIAAELDEQTGETASRGASRYFPVFRYEAKAKAAERPRVDGVSHPTVKPLALIRWMVRLVVPPGGVVLDPFAGSGTTVEACAVEGFKCVAIEREAEYLPLIEARIGRCITAPHETYHTATETPGEDQS